MMIQHNRPTLGLEEQAAVSEVIASGRLVHGPWIRKFEDDFCDYLGLPRGSAIAVSSGTSALYLALWSLGLKGKKVALPAYTCSSLRHATAMAGAKELICDITEGGPNLDPEIVSRSDAEAVILPHMFGLPTDPGRFGDRVVIEDCAQALGASIHGTPVGLRGKVGVFSFYATKLMTSGGQGGMIVSKDANIIERIRDYLEFDQRRDFKPRFNFDMTELQARVGCVQLSKFPGFVEKRQRLFRIYQENGLCLMDGNSQAGERPVRFRAILRTDRPNALIEKLESAGVRAVVPIPDWQLPEGDFTRANALSHHSLSLPLYPLLGEDEVNRIANLVVNS